MADSSAELPMVYRLAESLHDMCQPLTALQCRLEISQVPGEAVWVECIAECARLNAAVHSMRLLVERAIRTEQAGQGAIR